MNTLLNSLETLRISLLNKDATAVSITEACLKRGQEYKDLNCFISFCEDHALERSRWADQAIIDGAAQKLLGLPIAIKDLILVKDTKTTAGSKILENFVAPYNATVIEKLLAAGAVPFGKTNLDEFAMGSSNESSFFGPVLNPWNKDYVSGGSSGGSAVAVASGICPVALGSDTGGSIRQPASFCGIVGIRPTYGRVSRYGVVAYASSLDQVGVFAKNVTDAACVLEVISGYDEKDATSSKQIAPQFCADLKSDIKGLKIGLPKQYFSEGLQPEVLAATKAALAKLESLGATLVEIDLPHTQYAIAVYYILAPAEASSNLSRYDGIRYGYRALDCKNLNEQYCKTRSQGFGSEAKLRILIGTYVLSKGYFDRYYKKARKVQSLIANDFYQAFEKQCDIIAAPTAPTTAFKIAEKTNDPLSMYLGDILTIPSNLAGLPALSIPCGFDQKGLPIGLQLIGNKWCEQSILNTALAYEQASDWHLKTPPGFEA